MKYKRHPVDDFFINPPSHSVYCLSSPLLSFPPIFSSLSPLLYCPLYSYLSSLPFLSSIHLLSFPVTISIHLFLICIYCIYFLSIDPLLPFLFPFFIPSFLPPLLPSFLPIGG